MSEMTAMELAQQRIAVEPVAQLERGADWPLATAFFGAVLAIYAAIGYALYLTLV